MKFTWCSVAIAALALGCRKSDLSSGPSNPTPPLVDVTGYEVSLHNTPEGTLYTVHDPKGKILSEEITAEELATRFPNIHHEVQNLGSVNFIEMHRTPDEPPIKEPNKRVRFFRERLPPTLEETLIDLPPLPDLRTVDQKTRREKPRKNETRKTTNQPGK